MLKSSSGLELIKDIHARWPRLLILVVSMHDETLYAERVLRAGARGYITKQQATRDILLAIRRVLGGGIYLSEKTASTVLGAPDLPAAGGERFDRGCAGRPRAAGVRDDGARIDHARDRRATAH